MKEMPLDIQHIYHLALRQYAQQRDFPGFKKYFCYYWKYCQSQQLEEMDIKSLNRMIRMLEEKDVKQEKLRRVKQSVLIYINYLEWQIIYTELTRVIKLRHYSPKTLKLYLSWAKKLACFCSEKEPKQLNKQDVEHFLSHLAVDKQMSASSQNQAFNALLFLFKQVLKKDIGRLRNIVKAKRKPYIPVVLSVREVKEIMAQLKPPYLLIVQLLYGCGLRLSECLKLRVQNFNLDMGVLTIHNGKGNKDRTVPLPKTIESDLRQQLTQVIQLHKKDLQANYDGVFLVDAIEKKSKNAAKELSWQWFFPAYTLTDVKETREKRRYHIHESRVQRAIKQAVSDAYIPKRASAHTFRHSFASHLLQANFDICTIQNLLGHSDIRTTMLYTQTIKSTTHKDDLYPVFRTRRKECSKIFGKGEIQKWTEDNIQPISNGKLSGFHLNLARQ